MDNLVPGIPEDYFTIPKEMPKDLSIDVLSMLLSRARSVLLLLEIDGQDLKEGFTLNHASVMEVLSCVLGHVIQAEQMIGYAISTDKEGRRSNETTDTML